jgi:phage recombination protein Bet
MTPKKERMETAVALAKAEGKRLTITFDDVKRYICPDASDAEIGLFLKVCASENLNPFRGDCYLVKYRKDQRAAIIISAEAFLRAAENCPEYDGAEAGIILKDATGKLEFREGSFLLEEEEGKLVGGWAKVYRKDWQKPIYAAVNIKECRKYTREGELTRFWQEMPATMVRKVALSRALREAFPNRFAGTLTTAEFQEIPEGELPPAYSKNGKPDWPKFWARQKEKGLTPDDVHGILNIGSLKDDWLAKGRTLEEAEDIINDALEKANKTRAEAEAKPKRDPETIKTIAQLIKACFEDFKLQPKDVYAKLNVKSANEITDTPAECYRKIATVRE